MYQPLRDGSRVGRVQTRRIPIIVLRVEGKTRGLALLEHSHAATSHEFFDVVDEEAVCSDHHVVRFEDGAELAGLFEVKQDLAFAGRVEQNCVDLFEQRGVGVVQRDLDAE